MPVTTPFSIRGYMLLRASLLLFAAALGAQVKRPGPLYVDWGKPVTERLIFAAHYNTPNPTDVVGPNAAGSIVGTVPWGTTPAGMGFDVPGTSGNRVVFTTPQKTRWTETSSFSVCSIFTVDAGDGTGRSLLRQDSCTGSRTWWGIGFILTDNKLHIRFGNSAGTEGALGATNTTLAADGKVVSACWVRDVALDTLYVYIDGVLDASGADASTSTWTVGNFDLRSSCTTTSEHWNGRKIQDLIWNRALRADEVRQLHATDYDVFEGFGFDSRILGATQPVAGTFSFGIINNPVVQ